MRNFKIGQKVRIYRKLPTRYNGWQNSWVKDMDEYIGKIFTIEYIHISSKEVYFKEIALGWPIEAIQPISEQLMFSFMYED